MTEDLKDREEMTSGPPADQEEPKEEPTHGTDAPEAQPEEAGHAEDGGGAAEKAGESSGEDCPRSERKKKKDKTEALKKEIEELRQHKADLTDRVQRTMAEFDNYRKRTEKEKDARFAMGERSVIEKILPVLDSLERGLDTADRESEDPFVRGVDQVYRQFRTVLADMGVEEIPALGEKFNPDLHNAVMHAEDEEKGENEIVEVFSKGYTYKGSVVRFSMVKVVN